MRWDLDFRRLTSQQLLRRREVLLSGAVAAVSGVYATSAQADNASSRDTRKVSSLPAAPKAPLPKDIEYANFINLSQCLTERTSLNYPTGVALYNAIVNAHQERRYQLTELHELMVKRQITRASTLARLAERKKPVFKTVIQEILLAWYRGVAAGKVVVYGSALMFDITKDAVYPKTYAQGAPFYWKYTPPEVVQSKLTPSLSPSPLVIEPT